MASDYCRVSKVSSEMARSMGACITVVSQACARLYDDLSSPLLSLGCETQGLLELRAIY